MDDTELYFFEEVVVLTFCGDTQQTSLLPVETDEEFEILSVIPLPPDPPSSGDLGGCK